MNDKPRMVTVSGDELAALIAGRDDLSTPMLYRCGSEYTADADELRAWRASQSTSHGEPK